MEALTNAEEKVMQIVWKVRKGFVKDFLAEISEPKPSYTTVSTIIRILENKGFINHKAYGKTHEYFPIVSKMAYRKFIFSRMLKDYFEDSYGNVMSYMVSEETLSEADIAKLEDLINDAEQQAGNE
ncbi:MAG: hypothetical protein RIS47_2165 [Bacteroidota bacterium]|jgi:predicted transcriptional regulator